MENAERIFSIRGPEVSEWLVERRTAKMLHVVNDGDRIHGWRRTYRTALLGSDWFTSKSDALQYEARRIQGEIDMLKSRLQNKRTLLGMIESALKRERPNEPIPASAGQGDSV